MDYPRNYLRKVICRLDFPAPLGFAEGMADTLKASLRATLPVLETQQFQGADFQLKLDPNVAPQLTSKAIAGIEWRFHSELRDRHLTIGPDFLTLEFDRFVNFTDFAGVLNPILSTLEEAKGNLDVRRLGMRFINEVSMPDGAPTDWAGYISPKLTEMFDVADNPESLMRVMALAELSYGEVSVRFQYGMPNPDYPAPLRQRLFILDYDAHTSSGIELHEAATFADKCNQLVYRLFEQSIEDPLRERMKEAAAI